MSQTFPNIFPLILQKCEKLSHDTNECLGVAIEILAFCRPIKSFTKISVNFALARWLGRPPPTPNGFNDLETVCISEVYEI